MVQIGTKVKITDNTGAREGLIIGVPGPGNKRIAGLGDKVTLAVKKAMPHGMVSEHATASAVVVRLKKEFKRKDGSYIKFDDNAVVILESATAKSPKGSRVFGPIARELKDLGFDKIISLAPEVL